MPASQATRQSHSEGIYHVIHIRSRFIRTHVNRDTSAFELLYDRYERILYSIALRLTTRADLAEAVLSEVFTELWKRRLPLDLTKHRLKTHLFERVETAALRLVANA
ncbi:RNA polymerase sigma factor [Exiguobacterium sp. TNDT2]|uniref:RNA polymerase sigma factor n=1 Tax=Exiguobacterium sp. TNDT2 TaxID=2233531 RepID=UPI001300278B|nr:sigma factor [Exiguobacterium sp. TNDT2]